LTEEERHEITDLSAHAMKTIRAVSGADGFNLGMNQGAISGAGVAAHIHQHVVPRWSGDVNFMPIIGKTKVMPQLLTLTRDELVAAW
jgi:ATP adenylyltransferase